MAKSGVVAVVGRPSSGKSSLLNAICGHTVSIVSSVPQTTRNSIRGIFSDERGQIVFVDTPGFHRSEKKLNLALRDVVEGALEDIEAVLYVTDLARPAGAEEEEVIALVESLDAPCVAALNKIDVSEVGAQTREAYIHAHLPSAQCRRTSATTGEGVPELLGTLFELMPDGPALYPEEFYTDQEPRFRISEIIRERAIAHTRQEIPHSLYVEIADSRMDEKPNGTTRLWVRAFIYVERENQKGIVVGNRGERVRSIRLESERALRELFPYPIKIDLRVKVHPKWRSKDTLLRRLVH
jgi:GTP-binding protein Era